MYFLSVQFVFKFLVKPEVATKPKQPECIVIECEQEKNNANEVCIIEEVSNQIYEPSEKHDETFSDSDVETVVEAVDEDKNRVDGGTSRPNSFYIRQINDEVQVNEHVKTNVRTFN